MQKNLIIAAVVAAVIIIGGVVIYASTWKAASPSGQTAMNEPSANMAENNESMMNDTNTDATTPDTNTGDTMMPDTNTAMPNSANDMMPDTTQAATGQVKEFSMTAYYDPATGDDAYSLKDITVKQGDTVKLDITNTFGTHDIKIDEYNIYQQLPANQVTTVQFTADKVGDFVYYCTKPGHREHGMWGTLHVLAQ
jgi:plastocyanin